MKSERGDGLVFPATEEDKISKTSCPVVWKPKSEDMFQKKDLLEFRELEFEVFELSLVDWSFVLRMW